MADLTPTPGWDTVPQLETSTPALGGPGGPMNSQAQALLNRTEALRTAHQLADYTALRAYAGDMPSVYVTGYLVSAAPSGIAGMFVRDDADTTSTDNGGTVIVASNGKRWKRSVGSEVDVKWFGAIGGDGADDYAEFAAATSVAAATGLGVLITAGSYTLSSTWAITTTGMRVRAEGKVVLNFTNAGNCVAVDGGASSSNIYDVHFGEPANPIWINGNSSTTNALYWRAAHHGTAAIKAWNCITGHRTEFAVVNNFWITVSAAERVSNVLVPTTGIYCDHRASGEDTADNNWWNPVIEGIKTSTGIGIRLVNTNRNKFFGGTSEGNVIGVLADATALGDYFQGLYCEVNTGAAHFDISGTLITLADCLSATSAPTPTDWIRIRAAAKDCRIIGGNHPSIIVEAGALRTQVLGNANAAANTVNDSGTNTTVIQGSAANKFPFGANFGGGAASLGVYDELTWTPSISGSTTPGTPTYTVQNGTYQKIGKWIHFRLYVLTTGLGGAAGNFQISLPVASNASANTHASIAVGRFNGVTFDAGYSMLAAIIPPNDTNLTMYESGSGVNSQPIPCTKFAAATLLMIEGKYMIA